MFVTIAEVASITGYTVTAQQIAQAQALIEVYVGRTEAEVTDLRDVAMLGRAVAFEAVYLQTNTNVTYEQTRLKSITSGGTSYTFHAGDDVAPYISPLAVMACKRLSWMRPRSVKTGRILQHVGLRNWWTN